MVKFNGLECQDRFAYALLKDIKDGFYIDCCCQHAIVANNTYIFDEELKWKGLGFDRYTFAPCCGPFNWDTLRTGKFIQTDVCNDSFYQILLDNVTKDTIVDYVSIDVDDNGGVNHGWDCLPRLINGGVRFKVMTLEHELYTQGDSVRLPTRILLEALGYRRLFSDVLLDANSQSFEDWWINPKYFGENIHKLLQNNITWLNYNKCIEIIESVT